MAPPSLGAFVVVGIHAEVIIIIGTNTEVANLDELEAKPDLKKTIASKPVRKRLNPWTLASLTCRYREPLT